MTAARVTEFHVPDLAGWRKTVATQLLPLDIHSDAPDFTASMRALTVGSIRLFTVTASPHRVERTERLAASGDPFFTISLQLEGASSIAQHGNDGMLQPGDFTVYDSTMPYSRWFDGDSTSLVVMFPQQLIRLPPRALAEIAGLRIGGNEGLGAVVSPFLGGVARNLSALEGRHGLSMAASMVDLVTAAFSEKMGVVSPSRSRRRLEQMIAVREWIMSRLGDVELSPASIAAGNFISTRHLHILFREQGTTVGTWVRERRLEMVRRDLVDPVGLGLTIAELAERWGFVDAGHFSRVFKQSYGVSPRRYRDDALGLSAAGPTEEDRAQEELPADEALADAAAEHRAQHDADRPAQ